MLHQSDCSVKGQYCSEIRSAQEFAVHDHHKKNLGCIDITGFMEIQRKSDKTPIDLRKATLSHPTPSFREFRSAQNEPNPSPSAHEASVHDPA